MDHFFDPWVVFLKMAKCKTTSYRLSSNGQVDRKNCEILNQTRCYLGTEQRHWDNKLSIIGMELRAIVNCTNGLPPTTMMLGREVTLPSELTTGISLKNEDPLDTFHSVQFR